MWSIVANAMRHATRGNHATLGTTRGNHVSRGTCHDTQVPDRDDSVSIQSEGMSEASVRSLPYSRMSNGSEGMSAAVSLRDLVFCYDHPSPENSEEVPKINSRKVHLKNSEKVLSKENGRGPPKNGRMVFMMEDQDNNNPYDSSKDNFISHDQVKSRDHVHTLSFETLKLQGATEKTLSKRVEAKGKEKTDRFHTAKSSHGTYILYVFLFL